MKKTRRPWRTPRLRHTPAATTVPRRSGTPNLTRGAQLIRRMRPILTHR